MDQKLFTIEDSCKNFILIRRSELETSGFAYVECKWECFQWKAHGQCSKGDSWSFSHDIQASGNSGKSQRPKGRSSSLASHPKAKQTDGEEPQYSLGSGSKQENLLTKSGIPCRFKFSQNPSCKFWHPPMCRKDTFQNICSKNTISDMLRQNESQTRRQTKVVRRTSCYIEGVFTIGLYISKFLSEKIYSTWICKIGIETHRQILQRHLEPNENSGKKGSIARSYPKVCASWA